MCDNKLNRKKHQSFHSKSNVLIEKKTSVDGISDILTEIVKTACELSENTSKIETPTLNNTEKTDEQKSNSKFLEESDTPVRRSNRLRKSVVKKDEFLSPRSKKNNKVNKNNDTSDLKATEIENKKLDPEKQSNEDLNKTSSGVKNKGNKFQKNDQKSPLNAKRSAETDKKKPARKKKSDRKVIGGLSDTDNDKSENEKFIQSQNEIKADSIKETIDSVINGDHVKCENVITSKVNDDHSTDVTDKTSDNSNIKPVKVKSRWWRSSELEAVKNSESSNSDNKLDISPEKESIDNSVVNTEQTEESAIIIKQELTETPLDSAEKSEEVIPDESKVAEINVDKVKDVERPVYDHIEENIYRFNRKKCKSKKQVRRMVCDCTLTKEEQEYGIMGCKEECLNRLLMIECGSRCPLGEACSNKNFQKKRFVKTVIFKTEKKGWGVRALEDTSTGDFVMEFVGEILNHKEYRQRVKQYAKEKNVHSYFMAFKPDEILDATYKGNFSRFINHSCDPNCETQKWTVNGELRVGVFAKRPLQIGEELTLDYQFQRYGREAQKCYCGAGNCSGFIGGSKQISVDAYSGTRSLQSRKRKGSEEKKRDWEDMILEEEIEKLNDSRGLRIRDDTLKLARLMVRADDSATRHQLLDIILKTEEQACLRLFLDYHGLPLLWSWMTDVVEFDLKIKILQVLSLLPISNKTMLLDSKVMNIVEKWIEECSLKSDTKKESCPEKSSPVNASDDIIDSTSKKLKISEFSDSETDSTSSHTITDSNIENASVVTETHPKNSSPSDSIPSESCKENSCDKNENGTDQEDPDNSLKLNIASVASELLNNWKNLKEVFRIPRLEQQKRKEDEMEVDNNAKEKVVEEKVENSPKCGDQIQVVISGKNVFSNHHRVYDYEQQDLKLEDSPRRFSYPRAPPVLAKPRQVNKPIRCHSYPKQIDKDLTQQKEDISELSPDILPTIMPPDPQLLRPPLTSPSFEQLPHAYPPPTNLSILPPHQPAETSSSLIYPPPIMYPTQLPFVGSSAPVHPHNPPIMPPPNSVPTQPSLIQQPPINAGMPPCQTVPPSQPNISAPPLSTNNFILPQNVPPATVVPGTSQFMPSHSAPMQTFPPGPNVFNNHHQQVYFIPQQSGIPNNPPPASFAENIPIQQNPAFPVQPVPLVKEEPPKPIKLPKNWRTATDSEGNVYYYHSITRHTQWDPPSEDDDSDDDDEDSNSEESESSDTPTYDEPKVIYSKHYKKKSKKRKPTKAAADTSVAPVRPEVAKKIKELFRTKMSSFIVCCLNAYRKPSCNVGRITSNEDFKYLARKLTHYTMTKELKQCKNVEDLDCNETVMHKAKDFIKKYMAKYGSQYVRKEKYSPEEE